MDLLLAGNEAADCTRPDPPSASRVGDVDALRTGIERRRRLDRGWTSYISIHLAGIGGRAGDTDPVVRRDVVGDPLDLPARVGTAEHQDRARACPRAHGDMCGPRRRVQVVPLSHDSLLAFDHGDALAA